MTRALLGGLVAIAGCGRVGFEPVGDAVADPDLVAHYTFDRVSAGSVADVTGHDHDASCAASSSARLFTVAYVPQKCAAPAARPSAIARAIAMRIPRFTPSFRRSVEVVITVLVCPGQ